MLKGVSNAHKGQIGVNLVESIILTKLGWRWQAIDGHNDDGVDGLLFIQRGAELTGQVVFVQIKFRKLAASAAESIKVSINSKRLKKNAARWGKLVGAAIIVFVDADSLEAYWADLKRTDTISDASITIPLKNRFNSDASVPIQRLCGTLHKDQNYPVVDATSDDFLYLSSRNHLQVSARALYHDLRDKPVLIEGFGRPIRFLRSGWRHITRRDRAQASRFQSFVLLGCVRRILEGCEKDDLVMEGNVSRSGDKLYGIRRYVTFPFRQSALVTIILEKKEDSDGYYFSFYTVYEPRRKRSATGVARKVQVALSK